MIIVLLIITVDNLISIIPFPRILANLCDKFSSIVKKPASSTKRQGRSSVAVEHCQITCELSKELQPGYFPIQGNLT